MKINIPITALLLVIPQLYYGNFYKKSIFVLMRTRAGFHLSRYYNKVRYGSLFEFHQITNNQTHITSNLKTHNNITIYYDTSGAIKAIHDGKKTPIVLSSIPGKSSHIEQICKAFNNQSDYDKSIGIFTLNEPWECKSAGLSKLVKNNQQITQFNYPTSDFTAPSFIDLLRAIHDLENRDNYHLQVALVHCKAGRGRSATILIAYLMHIMHKANIKITPQEIEAYLVQCRSQVRLSREQKQIVVYFYQQLQNAGSFEKLCEKYQKNIEQRNQEVKKIFGR